MSTTVEMAEPRKTRAGEVKRRSIAETRMRIVDLRRMQQIVHRRNMGRIAVQCSTATTNAEMPNTSTNRITESRNVANPRSLRVRSDWPTVYTLAK
jgi:hypothetical protein